MFINNDYILFLFFCIKTKILLSFAIITLHIFIALDGYMYFLFTLICFKKIPDLIFFFFFNLL